MSTKQDQDPLGEVAGIVSSEGAAEQRPPTLQVELMGNDNYILDGQHMISESRMRNILMELQQLWLKEYEQNREKLMVELIEKLHQEYQADLQLKQAKLMNQCREQIEAEKIRQEELYQGRLQEEVQRLAEKQQTEIGMTKKKQWCWQCGEEAIYPCCWNTAYCSLECQQAHWPMHRPLCRLRKMLAQQAGKREGGGVAQQQQNNNASRQQWMNQ